MFRLPRIASPEAHERAHSVGMWLIGGVVALGTAFVNPGSVLIPVVGVALIVAAAYRWFEASRCPKCADPLLWRALTDRSIQDRRRWLAELRACPACGYSPPTARISLADDLRQALDDARELARKRGAAHIEVGHCLIALSSCPSVVQLLRTLSIDRFQLEQAGDALLGQPVVSSSEPIKLADDLQACVNRAASQVVSADLEEITPVLVLEAIMAYAPGSVRERLRTIGLSEYAIRVSIAHGVADLVDPVCNEGTVRVVLHNDPFTTRQFVQEQLTSLFGFAPDDAIAAMSTIHKDGAATVATLPAEDATQRIRALRERALARQLPLRISLE